VTKKESKKEDKTEKYPNIVYFHKVFSFEQKKLSILLKALLFDTSVKEVKKVPHKFKNLLFVTNFSARNAISMAKLCLPGGLHFNLGSNKPISMTNIE
jgi:hypothetical protein